MRTGEKYGQSSSSLSIMNRRFFSAWTIFKSLWKIWKVQPLIEPMLAPAKTGAVEDRSGSTLEFIIEFTAAIDDAFWLEEHESIWRSLKLRLIFHYWSRPCWVLTTFFFDAWSWLICMIVGFPCFRGHWVEQRSSLEYQHRVAWKYTFYEPNGW